MWLDTIRKAVHYLLNLEWTEKKQDKCIFCHRESFHNIVYEDDTLIAVDNIRSAGRTHWLIMPKWGAARHIRDVEALSAADIPLLEAMRKVKDQLLNDHYPYVVSSAVQSGYHRGRRRLVGPIILPDIVSIHHLHLHVIVEPQLYLRLFKYPVWFSPMWISERRVLDRLKRQKQQGMPAMKED